MWDGSCVVTPATRRWIKMRLNRLGWLRMSQNDIRFVRMSVKSNWMSKPFQNSLITILSDALVIATNAYARRARARQSSDEFIIGPLAGEEQSPSASCRWWLSGHRRTPKAEVPRTPPSQGRAPSHLSGLPPHRGKVVAADWAEEMRDFLSSVCY